MIRSEYLLMAKIAVKNPTQAMYEAGNYKKWHIRRDGMEISIENRKGAIRSGKSSDGKEWHIEMKHHYGYIKGTIGKDKDHIDVFIKPGSKEGGPVFVVNQTNDKGNFDEHKCLFGFNSKNEAEKAYLANYEKGWDKYDNIIEMSMPEFKEWVFSGRKMNPAKEKMIKKAIKQDVLSKLISRFKSSGRIIGGRSLSMSTNPSIGTFIVKSKKMPPTSIPKVISKIYKQNYDKKLTSKKIVGKIMSPGGGMGGYKFKNTGIDKKELDEVNKLFKNLSNKSKANVNRVAMAHEISELGQKKLTPFFSHTSPKVLIDEHNILKTLGDKGTTKFFRKIRGMTGEKEMISEIGSLNYGISSRINRRQKEYIQKKFLKKIVV